MKRTYLAMLLFTIILSVGVIGTDISSCTTISSGGSYQLINNISSSDTCLQVTASEVVIDCQGYKITYGTGGNLGYAVNNTGDGVQLRNCEIVEGSAVNYCILSNRTNLWKYQRL